MKGQEKKAVGAGRGSPYSRQESEASPVLWAAAPSPRSERARPKPATVPSAIAPLQGIVQTVSGAPSPRGAPLPVWSEGTDLLPHGDSAVGPASDLNTGSRIRGERTAPRRNPFTRRRPEKIPRVKERHAAVGKDVRRRPPAGQDRHSHSRIRRRRKPSSTNEEESHRPSRWRDDGSGRVKGRPSKRRPRPTRLDDAVAKDDAPEISDDLKEPAAPAVFQGALAIAAKCRRCPGTPRPRGPRRRPNRRVDRLPGSPRRLAHPRGRWHARDQREVRAFTKRAPLRAGGADPRRDSGKVFFAAALA